MNYLFLLCLSLSLHDSFPPRLPPSVPVSQEVSQISQIITDVLRSKKMIQLIYSVLLCTAFVSELCLVENGWKLPIPGQTVPFIDHQDVLQIASQCPLPRQHAHITLLDSCLSLPALSGTRQTNIYSYQIEFHVCWQHSILAWIIWGQKNIFLKHEYVSWNILRSWIVGWKKQGCCRCYLGQWQTDEQFSLFSWIWRT